MKSLELKYPIKIEGLDEIKYLTPQRLKVKHFKLLPESLMEKAGDEGVEKLKLTAKEMLPIFKDLVPFLAGIYSVKNEVIEEVDADDMENLINNLEQVFEDTQKKN